jgi:hypothetical protein
MDTTQQIERIEDRQLSKHQVFTSQAQCSSITGISKEILRTAKKNGAPGFRGSQIYWDELGPYLSKNKVVIEAQTEDTLKTRKAEGVKLDNEIKKLEIIKRKGEFLNPEEVIKFLVVLRLSFETVLKGWSSELPPMLVGKSQGEIEYMVKEQVTKLFNDFGELIRNEVNRCNKK